MGRVLTLAAGCGAGVLLTIVALVAIALALETFSEDRERAAPPPGRLVDIGGRRLHLNCQGDGGPTVVLEAGGGTPAILFRPLQERLASRLRVCVYDRAGFGWSDPAPKGRTFEDRARDLHQLLAAAAVPGPYILAGESFGGLLVRTFARLYPQEVAGLVLIDAAEEEVVFHDFANFRRSGELQMAVVPLLARLGVLRWAIAHRPAAIGLPEERLSHVDRRALAALVSRQSHWLAVRDELSAYDLTPAGSRISGGFGSLRDLPLTVIAHGQAMRGPQSGLEPAWRAGQVRLADLSSVGRLVVAEHSGHNISMSDPDLVAREILRLTAEIRHPASSDSME